MTVTASPTGDKEVEVTLDLLVEYTEKLRSIEMTNKQSANQLMKSMGPHLVGLSRQVSQKIEHGKLHPVDKINLTLKLSEFEYQLNHISELLSKGSLR